MTRPLLLIGNKNYSSWSLRPWLLMKQAGIDFDERVIPLYNDASRQEILRHSPSGKLPCLIDGDLKVWDSLAICETVAESLPQLWPSDAVARAHARALSAEMHSGFTALRTRLPMNIRADLAGKCIEIDAERDIARIVEAWTECRSCYGAQGLFLFGTFGVADAMFAPVCFRFHIYGVPLPDAAARYRDTMLALPAMQQWAADARVEPWSLPQFEVG